MRVTVSIFTDSSLNGSRSKKVKFPITPYEKFDILFLRDNVMQEFIKTVLDLRNSFDAPIPEKLTVKIFNITQTPLHTVYTKYNMVSMWCQHDCIQK